MENNVIQAKKPRYVYISVAKLLSMFLVVFGHTIKMTYIYCKGMYSGFEASVSIFIMNFIHAWVVPIFIMSSGALFLSKDIPIKTLITKYVSRVVLLICTFGFLYCLIEAYYIEKAFNGKVFLKAVMNTFTGKSWQHMWYLYMLVPLYLLVPVFRVIVKDEKIALYFVIVLFIYVCVFRQIEDITNITFVKFFPFSMEAFLLYFVLGYVLFHNIIKINNKIAIVLVSISVIYLIVAMCFPEMYKDDYLTVKYMTLDYVPGVLLSVGIFSLLKNNIHRQTENIFEKVMMPLSLGVYIIHPVFINFVYKGFGTKLVFGNILLYSILLGVIVSVLSIVAIYLLRLIPFMKKYIL